MSQETKAVLFNAVPLFAVAAVYLAVTVVVVPRLWRERKQLIANDLALGLLFPCVGIPAGILGAAVHLAETSTRRPGIGDLSGPDDAAAVRTVDHGRHEKRASILACELPLVSTR